LSNRYLLQISSGFFVFGLHWYLWQLCNLIGKFYWHFRDMALFIRKRWEWIDLDGEFSIYGYSETFAKRVYSPGL